MYTVNITLPAEQDLNAAVEYYCTVLKAPEAAHELVDQIEKKLIFLSTDPLVYKLEHDEYLREHHIRSVLVKNHLIFYRVDPVVQEVLILRILYARRNWLEILCRNT